MRAFAPAIGLLLLAGCIAAQPDEEIEAAQAPPEDVRIDGMTITEEHADTIVDCNEEDGLLAAPAVCAERVLVAEGEIGVDRLPVELIGSNGEIRVVTSDGDAWRFTATVRVQALTEDLARDGLDTTWTWRHEDDDGHAIYAGPTPRGNALGVGARIVSSAYELEVPAWIVLDLKALTDNGGIATDEFTFGAVDVETDNGQIILMGAAESVRGRTDNGGISATLKPAASGEWDLSTDNGQIVLTVPEGSRYGYDITGTTDNGQVVIDLRDGDVKQTEGGASFTTRGFAQRAVRTTMKLQTDNGQAVVASSG